MAQSSSLIGNDLGLRCVMVSRFAALGNVVMTIPVLYSACATYPDIKFVMVTKASLTDLFVNKPDNLVIEGCLLDDRYSTLMQRYRLARSLWQKYRYDAYIDLQNDATTAPLRWYTRLHHITTVKFNKATSHKRRLTRRTNKVMLPMVSTRARYREAFFAAGLPIQNTFEGIYSPSRPADPTLFESIASDPKAPGQRWIGIAPFAAYAQKEYPLEKMGEVIDLLSHRLDCRIFIFGGKGREQQCADDLARTRAAVTSLAGASGRLSAELALLSHLDIMITMDSANMHLASITGTPTISIWGATHHYCGYKGWRQSENDMVQLPLSCRPCSLSGEKPCMRGDRLCLTAIRPETIYLKVLDVLGEPHT